MTDTTLRQRVDALIADSHATGYGSELPASVTRLVQTVADAVGSGTVAAPASPATPDPAIEALTKAVADLQAKVETPVIAGPDPAIATLKTQVAAVKAEVDALVKALSGLAPMAAPAA